MKIKSWGFATLFVCSTIFAACSDEEATGPTDPDNPGAEGVSAYVVAGTVGSEAAYVLTSQSLDEGSISASGNGYETSYANAATWLFYGNKYLYRLGYNMGQAGTTVSFYLGDDGAIHQRPNEYNISNFTAYGTYGNNIIVTGTGETDKVDEKGNKAYGINFNIIDVEKETTEIKTISAENFLGNGEYVMLAGLLEANGKIYAGVVPLGCSAYGVAAGGVKPGNEDLVKTESGGTGGGMYTAGSISGTQYPDNCYVAIFNDATFTNPTIVQTDKMSWAAGRMRSAYYQMVWAADNGDVYVFSPSYAKTESDSRQRTVRPSSVMRIKAGATEFDDTYEPFNIEEAAEAASGGSQQAKARPNGGEGGGGSATVTDNSKAVYRCWHITEDYFLLQMYTNGINVRGTGTTKMAIFKGGEREFRYVTGLPSEDVISSFSTKNPYCENGVCYISVVTTDGASPRIYKIDPVTATATPGLVTEFDDPGAIGKLIAQ